MVDGGARVKTRPDDGFTPLHAAAWMGKYDTAKLLLEEGSDVHLAHKNHQGTALHMAVYYGHYDCVRLLLRWGAKVNVRMSGGATPLFLAVEKGPAQGRNQNIIGVNLGYLCRVRLKFNVKLK